MQNSVTLKISKRALAVKFASLAYTCIRTIYIYIYRFCVHMYKDYIYIYIGFELRNYLDTYP